MIFIFYITITSDEVYESFNDFEKMDEIQIKLLKNQTALNALTRI